MASIASSRTGYINGTTSGWSARSLFYVNDALYAVVLDTAVVTIAVYKSINGGTTWTRMDTGNEPFHNGATLAYDANIPFTENNYIYVAYCSAASTYRVRRFNYTTDTWETTDIGNANASTTVNSNFTVRVAIRADGDVLLFYRASTNIVAWTRYEGTSWAAQASAAVSASGYILDVTMNSTSTAHIHYFDVTNGDNSWRTVTGGNTFNTEADHDNAAGTIFSAFSAYVVDGATHRLGRLVRDTGTEFDFVHSANADIAAATYTAIAAQTATNPGLLGGVVVPYENKWHVIWSSTTTVQRDASDDYATPAFGADTAVVTGLAASDPAVYATATPTGIPVLYTIMSATPVVDIAWPVGAAPVLTSYMPPKPLLQSLPHVRM